MRETATSSGVLRAAPVLRILLLLAIGFGGVPDARSQTPPPAPALKPVRPGHAPPNPYPKKLVARGKLLVVSSGCNDCHTPWHVDPELGVPAPDWSRMLSGHPEGGPDPQGEIGPADIGIIGPTFTSFKLPFGITYSMNLTPDIDTGTGSWTEKMFIDIFRKGRHLGGDGRPVYPPMPWDSYRNRSDEDLKAMFAYLRSIPPLRNMPPTEKVPPPVEGAIVELNDKIIALQANPAAKLEAPKGGPPPPAPLPLKPVVHGTAPKRSYSAEMVRKGKVIVTAGACNVCHTPWVFNPVLGAPAPDWTRLLSGHPEGAPDPQGKRGSQDIALIGPTFTSFQLPFGVVYSKNLTPDVETGSGGWTEEKFLSIFRTARHPDGRVLLPPMPWDMIRILPDADLRAVFAYLQSIPPIRNEVPVSKVPPEALGMLGGANTKMLLHLPGPR
jgi:mono/diheme cytochrome c family protein